MAQLGAEAGVEKTTISTWVAPNPIKWTRSKAYCRAARAPEVNLGERGEVNFRASLRIDCSFTSFARLQVAHLTD